jgi:DUF1680 family protein
LIVIVNTAFADGRGAVDTSKSRHAKLRSVPMEDVRWTTGFWADRFELCRTSMLPRLHSTMLDPKCSAQLNRLKFGAGMIRTNPEAVAWSDGDNYKWIEAMCGPLVYCLELPKREGGEKTWHDGVFLPDNIALKPEHRRDFLGGVTVLKGNALTFRGRDHFIKDIAGAAAPKPAPDRDDWLYRSFTPRAIREADEGTIEILLIPYYTWANRGLSMMEVWIPLAR